MESENPTIAIIGASGYIGQSLIPHVLERFPKSNIHALSRRELKFEDDRITWKSCDLFSLKSIEDALPQKLDASIYLVHSMGPTAQLDQGSFNDYDLILADNFARTVKQRGVKQVIYLGGLIPEGERLSTHLESRLEVEKIFRQHDLPTTVFRAGLILGEKGSSFQMLIKLVRRLPIMICPSWTQTQTSPVDLSSVLFCMVNSLLDEKHVSKVYDLTSCPAISYIEMMRETARKMGKKRYFFTVPFFTPTLSRLWVSLITGAPKSLVYPLIGSLKSPMLAREDHEFPNIKKSEKYFDLLSEVDFRSSPIKSIFYFRPHSNSVRSVQRLVLPPGKNAVWVKDQYMHWLPRFLSPFIKVNIEGKKVSFCVIYQRFCLLQIRFSSERSTSDRQLFYIVKGALVSGSGLGRLEFREVLNRKYILAAIHDYQPSLPWFIYIFTQAKAHVFVMKSFKKYLLNSQE